MIVRQIIPCITGEDVKQMKLWDYYPDLFDDYRDEYMKQEQEAFMARRRAYFEMRQMEKGVDSK